MKETVTSSLHFNYPIPPSHFKILVMYTAEIEKTENYRFWTDLEFVRPVYFAKNVFLFGPKIHTFTITYPRCQPVYCL